MYAHMYIVLYWCVSVCLCVYVYKHLCVCDVCTVYKWVYSVCVAWGEGVSAHNESIVLLLETSWRLSYSSCKSLDSPRWPRAPISTIRVNNSIWELSPALTSRPSSPWEPHRVLQSPWGCVTAALMTICLPSKGEGWSLGGRPGLLPLDHVIQWPQSEWVGEVRHVLLTVHNPASVQEVSKLRSMWCPSWGSSSDPSASGEPHCRHILM